MADSFVVRERQGRSQSVEVYGHARHVPIDEDHPLDTITHADLPNKGFYDQTWRYSGERLQQRLGFRPSHCWQGTLAEVVETKQ